MIHLLRTLRRNPGRPNSLRTRGVWATLSFGLALSGFLIGPVLLGSAPVALATSAPVVASSAVTTSGSSDYPSSKAITMPASIASGDLLVIEVATRGYGSTMGI